MYEFWLKRLKNGFKEKRPIVDLSTTFSNFAATLLLLSLKTKSIIHSHQFPSSVVPRSGSFLNDIAINLGAGQLGKFAYISDSDRGVLVVFSLAWDRWCSESYLIAKKIKFQHPWICNSLNLLVVWYLLKFPSIFNVGRKEKVDDDYMWCTF